MTNETIEIRGLRPDDGEAITAIYDDMREAAIAAGERFISAEAALSNAFANPELDEGTLLALLEESGRARTALRFIHLSQHLATPDLLSEAQVEKYSVLRGYSDDPCANVPEGHDPAMWRRHNGCE